jgi:hypothetical protein
LKPSSNFKGQDNRIFQDRRDGCVLGKKFCDSRDMPAIHHPVDPADAVILSNLLLVVTDCGSITGRFQVFPSHQRRITSRHTTRAILI